METIMNSDHHPVVEVVVEGLSPLGVEDPVVEVVVSPLGVVEDANLLKNYYICNRKRKEYD